MERAHIPTLYEWIGGMEKIETLTAVFYEKVLKDDLLEPIFRHMSADHPKHVAHFIAEVFKGPKTYSEHEGSHYQMIQKHFLKHLTEEARQRWIALLLLSADEIGVPSDPEFRSAFVAYLEWGTRIALSIPTCQNYQWLLMRQCLNGDGVSRAGRISPK